MFNLPDNQKHASNIEENSINPKLSEFRIDSSGEESGSSQPGKSLHNVSQQPMRSDLISFVSSAGFQFGKVLQIALYGYTGYLVIDSIRMVLVSQGTIPQ